MKNLTSICKFKEGTQIQGFYLCVEKHLRYTKAGDLFIDLELRDITGHITAKIWENVHELNIKFENGNAVVISGYVEAYLDHLQLVVKKINKATVQHYGRYGFDPANIVPTSKKDPLKMWKNILLTINEIKNKELQRLILLIYKADKKKILIHPASVKSSYNFRSGFLEHVLTMTQLVKKITPHYRVDKELVMAGVLLIKIGVLNGIKSGYVNDYSKEGNLIGQSVIAKDMMNNAVKKIKKFPLELKIKLEHIILSHENNYQSVNSYRPSFPEALLVHLIHRFDTNMTLMEQIINDDSDLSDFTSQRNYFGLPIFKK